MKRKNLFLSLISSIVVAVAIVTVTIVSVASPKKKNNSVDPGVSNIGFNVDYTAYEEENQNRDGSADSPYLIYSAESYVDMLSKYGSSNCHFELVEDIDFSKVEYITLFNKSKMNSTINGNGHVIKNITIHATKENIDEFSYGTYAHIALFGWMKNAKIENLEISNLTVLADADIYSSIENFETLYPYEDVIVSGISAIAQNTTLSNVTLSSNVTGFVYFDGINTNKSVGAGGVFGVAENLSISNSTLNASFEVNAGNDSRIGGVAGYGIVANVSESDINAKLTLSTANKVDFGGMFYYGKTLTIENVNANVEVNSKDSKEVRDAYLNSIEKDSKGLANSNDFSKGAGLVAYIRANDETQKSTFNNVKVTSNVDADIIYAGAFLDTWTTNPTNTDLILINDVVVDVDADVLALHGLARGIGAATITYSDEAKLQDNYFNIRMAGSVKLTRGYYFTVSDVKYTRPNLSIYIGIKTFIDNGGDTLNFNINDFYVEVSSEFEKQMTTYASFDWTKINVYYNGEEIYSFGSFKTIG